MGGIQLEGKGGLVVSKGSYTFRWSLATLL